MGGIIARSAAANRDQRSDQSTPKSFATIVPALIKMIPEIAVLNWNRDRHDELERNERIECFVTEDFGLPLALVGIVGTGVYWTLYFAVPDQPALIVKNPD